jgi:DNA repair ATPase RecN
MHLPEQRSGATMIEIPQNLIDAGAVVIVALTVLVIGLAILSIARGSSKNTDGITTVMKEQLKISQHQQEENTQYRRIIEGQNEALKRANEVSIEHLKLIKEIAEFQKDARRMTGIEKDQIIKQVDDVGKQLTTGVTVAQANNQILNELALKVNALPGTIAEAFKPSVEELHKIVEGVNKLTSEIHQRIKDTEEIEKTIDALKHEFTAACQNLSDRIDGLSKVQIEVTPTEPETPTIPSKPTENGKE